MLIPHHQKKIRYWILLTIIALFQTTQAISVLQLPDTIAQVIMPAPIIQILMALFWIIGCSIVGVLWIKDPSRALRYSRWLLFTFLIYSVSRIIIFAQADYDHLRQPMWFIMLISLLCIPISRLLYARWLRVNKREVIADGNKP